MTAPGEEEVVTIHRMSEEHLRIVSRMKRKFFVWFAGMLAFFMMVLGGVVYQIDLVSKQGCESINKVISVMVDYNNSVISFSDSVETDEFQARAVQLRRENNERLAAARCAK